MLFVTASFLLFFVIVYLLYWSLPYRFRLPLLICASLVFYATWSVPFTFHLLLVVGVNYYVMELWRIYRKRWIFISLQATNVINLAFFKYFYFLSDVIGRIFQIDALKSPELLLHQRALGYEILLPLAISFYTFQIMAYGIDIYRGVYTERHKFREVLLFKVFFPQLIAGPIMRSSELLPRISAMQKEGLSVTQEQMRRGLWFVMGGVFKKVIIADQLLLAVSPLLYRQGALPESYTPASIWIALFGATLMLYADFSAYSDIAKGLGLLLGFDIPANFRAPFFMTSISDFWKRWHLTFSTWIRDYIFIPLGGSRVPRGRVAFNLIFTFFLGGLWHGASYNFVIWGLVTGLILTIERVLFRSGLVAESPKSKIVRLLKFIVTWMILMLLGLFFFSPNLSWSISALKQMYSFHLIGQKLSVLPSAGTVLFAMFGVIFFHLVEEYPDWFKKFRKHDLWLLPLSAMVLVLLLTQFGGGPKDFFYFQF